MIKKDPYKKQEEMALAAPIIAYLNIDNERLDWNYDCPDCRYASPDGIIGIEVTRCFNDNDETLKMQKEIEDACRKAERKLFNMGFHHLEVQVLFTHSLQRKSMIIKNFSVVITEEIITGVSEELNNNEKKVRKPFSGRYVEKVIISKATLNHVVITPVLFYEGLEIGVGALIKRISQKDNCLKGYRELNYNNNISAYWLFVILPFESFTFLGDLSILKVQSDYSHIFISDPFCVIQIK